ncbi:hypothetical protein Scep_003034 [Stephania cephalantha]|uniref:Uncharacterized protein n=1 Tax=Stephania cephalantha TaxID=152367 RepID=A0AAP0Q5J9_9MAGN
MDDRFFEIDPPPWPPPCPLYLLPFLSLAICIFVLSGTRKFFETRARLEMILFREWHSQGAFMVGSLTAHKSMGGGIIDCKTIFTPQYHVVAFDFSSWMHTPFYNSQWKLLDRSTNSTFKESQMVVVMSSICGSSALLHCFLIVQPCTLVMGFFSFLTFTWGDVFDTLWVLHPLQLASSSFTVTLWYFLAQFWVSPWSIQSAQDCRADMKTPSVNPAEHLVFTTMLTTMLIVFTTYAMEKVIEYVIFDPTIVLPHHFWTFIDHLHPITTSFFMTTLLWSTSGGVFHVAFNVFEEMSTNLSSAISHSMKSFPLIFPITSAGDLHYALFDFHYMGHTLFGQLVDSSLTLKWVSLLFILDDDMVQGEWGLACTVKTVAFSLVVLLHFWTDVTISMAWLSIKVDEWCRLLFSCKRNMDPGMVISSHSFTYLPPRGFTFGHIHLLR